MKKLKHLIIVITAIIFMGVFEPLYSQNFISECPHNQFIDGKSSPQDLIGGFYKPQRTDVAGAPENASLKVLLVFVQFKNETDERDYWPIGGAPVYMNELLAQNVNTIGNYWDRYNQTTEELSDWYQEVSKGAMHVTGKAYNIILDYDANHYLSTGLRDMNNEIINKLTLAEVDWQKYDYWSGSDGNFLYQPDDYIDMIIKVHRTRSVYGLFYSNASGYSCLGPEPWSPINIPVPGGKYINDGFSNIGSGLTIIGTSHGPASKSWVFNIARHEYGHYLFGSGHMCNGVGIMGGGDIYLGAWESRKLGYLTPTVVNFSNNPYTLNDITSRYSNGEILQVPVNDTNEYFLITNRQKVSLYDRTMLGDTTKDQWDRETNYGQGIYIYHHNHDLNFYSSNDLECADGLWNWTYTEQTTPDWSTTQILDVYERNTIPQPLLNDDGNVSHNNKAGRSCSHYNSQNLGETDTWFSRGKRHIELGDDGIDRIFTNDETFWTSRQGAGTRWDAFNMDYNEVFSPYSNPSSINWSNGQSGIFIYLSAMNGTTATLNIYKVGEDNMTEAQILNLTPPSRPMGIKVNKTGCMEGRRYPVLTWEHNMEPDMVNQMTGLKRYKIFRAFNDINSVPGYYTEIADIQISSDQPATYIDYNTYAECLPDHSQNNNRNRIRYKIKAVDIYNTLSVYSDFVSISTYYLNRGEGGDNLMGGHYDNSEKPNGYSLKQNYPNPFNPVTRITYALPNDGFATLKIFDILGREVATIVNEVKTAGYYTVDFDASRLSSGIYFYKLQSGTFTTVKRMVLVR